MLHWYHKSWKATWSQHFLFPKGYFYLVIRSQILNHRTTKIWKCSTFPANQLLLTCYPSSNQHWTAPSPSPGNSQVNIAFTRLSHLALPALGPHHAPALLLLLCDCLSILTHPSVSSRSPVSVWATLISSFFCPQTFWFLTSHF